MVEAGGVDGKLRAVGAVVAVRGSILVEARMPLAHLAGQTAGGRLTAYPRFYRCALGVLEGASAHVRQAAHLEDQPHHVVASIGFQAGPLVLKLQIIRTAYTV